MTSERVRIYEIAKKLGLPNKDVMLALSKNMGMKVKSHSSTISQEEADKLTAVLTKTDVSKPQKTEQPEKKTHVDPEIKREVKPEAKEQPKASPEAKPKQEEPRKSREGLKFYRPESRHSNKVFRKERFENQASPIQSRSERKEPPEKYRKPEYKPERPSPGQEMPKKPAQDRYPQKPDRQERFERQERPGRPAGAENRAPQQFRPQHQERRPLQQQEKRPPQHQERRPLQQQERRPPHQQERRPQPQQFQRPSVPVPPRQPAGEEVQRPVRKEEPVKKKESYRDRAEKERERLEEQKLQLKLQAEKKKAKAEEEASKEKIKEVFIDSPLTVGELAEKLGESVAAVIKQLMMTGVMATVNQTIDIETAKKAAQALEYTIIEPPEEPEKAEEKPSRKYEEEDESKLVERAPVVTIMGHVDHGKTTLLDSIRKTKHKIVSTEAGGITQSIGAYTAEINDKKIVFIDTPGHSAFTAMRARGAKATDIVIIVVAADDGIMPQTIEAINHAKAAKVPIIIAVNKIDKENADPDRALQQLTEHGLVPEKWGGDTITVEVSALQELNLNELLEYILLVAELEELKANPDRPASGVVIESKLDKGKGAVATLLVQAGTLRVCDYMASGTVGGRIRALIDDHGARIQEAGPSTPVEILGLSEIPEAGEIFEVVQSDKEMKDIVSSRKEQVRMSKLETLAPAHTKRDSLAQKLKGETKELNIIIKATTHGSAEAVSSSLQQLESKKIFVKIVHLAVGDISEADVMLASASEAIIIGFGVKEDPNALRVAAEEGVVIRKYDIIYKMLEDVEQTMLGLLEPEYKEVEIGVAEVRQIFTVGKNVKIAGCYVLEGKIIRNKDAIVVRDGKEIYKGPLSQLKRFKDDVKEVASGYECGISFDKFNNIEEGDLIKVLTKEEIQRHTLV